VSDVQTYHEHGYLILRDAVSPELLELLRVETTAICRGRRGDVDGIVPSGESDDDATVLRRHLCVHFPHKVSSVMTDAARLPGVVDQLTGVIGPNVKLMQSMLFIKSEGRPGQAWHQDEAHIPTRDRSLTAAWLALDDSTVENGCLWVIPGSHRSGVIFPTRPQDDDRFDCTDEAYAFGYREQDAVPVEIPAGSVLLFDGYLLHRSLPNSGRHGMRRALVNHYMSAESLLPWFPPQQGEAMALLDHRDIVMVAGRDPYAAAGTTDVMRPHVRPDREGGCLR
jgi:ectoine hydroxylase-related dioxygenase (phytanoyl-CoA dioxygenase family)